MLSYCDVAESFSTRRSCGPMQAYIKNVFFEVKIFLGQRKHGKHSLGLNSRTRALLQRVRNMSTNINSLCLMTNASRQPDTAAAWHDHTSLCTSAFTRRELLTGRSFKYLQDMQVLMCKEKSSVMKWEFWFGCYFMHVDTFMWEFYFGYR